MPTNSYSAPITFSQLLSMLRQLPVRQKIKIARELKKDVIDSKLRSLLESFKTDDLTLDMIDMEVNKVRKQLYEKKTKSIKRFYSPFFFKNAWVILGLSKECVGMRRF